MNKLTKGQKDYRRRKKEGERDEKRVTREDGKVISKVAKRQLCVRVNEQAATRLKEEAVLRGLSQGDMLTWMLIHGIPKYSSLGDNTSHNWPPQLLKPNELTVKYKGNKGDKQLNLGISSTAYNKLECHKTATGLSKARIVQTLILNYKFLSQQQLDKQREYRVTSEERYEIQRIQRLENYKKPTEEEIAESQMVLKELVEERERRRDVMCEGLSQAYQERLSDSDSEASDS